MRGDVAASLAVHDELLERRKVDVWVGAEPTFTRADSIDPPWTTAAEGDDKLARAYAVAAALADGHAGASLRRVIGRRYPGEERDRFAFGVRWRDDGAAMGARGAATDEPEPPPDALGGDRWLTVTPDPGVVEVNMAPCASAEAFGAHAVDVWDAARHAGLSPLRRRFNGDFADSGGGGQLTLGGETPSRSPFVRYPHVLPALIRYVNNHPALSYWFAGDCIGSASQGPRPDEGTRERYDELAVALDWLETRADRGALDAETLWEALAPLLVDAAGNAHRAEVNVEKLWNPLLAAHGPRNGRMGLVELRSIRMPERPEMLAALAALWRSIVARLVVSHYRLPLVDWHDELHDRFALPAALERDLRHVLGDLDEHGVGLPAQLRRELERWRPPGITCRLGDATLALRPALEFWPLIGDVASQEQESARWVDASTQRWELAIAGAGPERIAVGGKWVQLRAIGEDVRAIGVRRRIYEPQHGFHPGLPAIDPLVVEWSWQGRSQRVELWAWRPAGGPYGGLPPDDTDALARRQERVRIETHGREVDAHGYWPQTKTFAIDLRHGGSTRN